MSILVASLGLAFIVYINFEFAKTIQKIHTDTQLELHQIITPRVHKMAALIIGLIGVFFGIKGFKKTKKLSRIGIALSLLLITISFLPLWRYLISNATP